MKFFGDANLQQNELQNAVLSTLTTFPTLPKQGQVAFVNSIVYICVTAGSLPVWIPLTQTITAYQHIQSGASQTWTVTHNLNTTSVNTQIYDASNQVIIPDTIETLSPTTVRVVFNTASIGRAVVVTGMFDGNARPADAFTHFQSSASATWTINHNLGYNPIVRVFVGVNEVQPQGISFPTPNQTVITFSTPQVGYARFI